MGLFCSSAGCAYLPWLFACQISIKASSTGLRSPSSTRPTMVIRSPEIPGPARSAFFNLVRPMEKYGPTVCDVVACRLISFPSVRVRLFPGSGFASSQDDVKSKAKGVHRDRGFPIKNGDETIARLFIGGAIEDGIVGNQRITGKIHLRDETRREGW